MSSENFNKVNTVLSSKNFDKFKALHIAINVSVNYKITLMDHFLYNVFFNVGA